MQNPDNELEELIISTGLEILVESADAGDEYARLCFDEVCRKLEAAAEEPGK